MRRKKTMKKRSLATGAACKSIRTTRFCNTIWPKAMRRRGTTPMPSPPMRLHCAQSRAGTMRLRRIRKFYSGRIAPTRHRNWYAMRWAFSRIARNSIAFWDAFLRGRITTAWRNLLLKQPNDWNLPQLKRLRHWRKSMKRTGGLPKPPKRF